MEETKVGSKHESDFTLENYEEFYEDHHFQPIKEEHAFQIHRFIPRVAWAMDIAKKIKPTSILDLGCLDGSALLTLASVPSVKALVGVDLSEHGIKIAKERAKSVPKNMRFIKSDIESYLETTDDKFDMIICFEVIEHVKDPDRLIKLIDRVSNGQVLISTPDFEAPNYGKDDEQNKCHIRLYTLADEDYEAKNKYGTLRKATSMPKQIGKERIIEIGTYSELINVRYK